MKTISKRDVPFLAREDGKMVLVEYDNFYDKSNLVWLPNDPFVGDMKFVGISRGRSSLRMDVEDLGTGTKYGLFAQSMGDVITAMSYGRIKGMWQTAKQGANYGLLYLGPCPESV